MNTSSDDVATVQRLGIDSHAPAVRSSTPMPRSLKVPLRLKRFCYRLVFTIALAATLGGLSAEPARALPRDRCADALRQARTYYSLGITWYTHGRLLLRLGWIEQAQEAFDTAAVFRSWGDIYLSDYNNGC